MSSLSGQDRLFHCERDPRPLVVEIWSASTGAYGVDEKRPEYPARDDREIWRLHPFTRTLTAWRKAPDGTYDEVQFTGGTIELRAFPGVTINHEALFVLET